VIDTTGHVATRARLFRNRGEGAADRGQFDRPGEVFGVSGALALYRRTMLDEVAWRCDDGRLQWLTEDLFAYFEDVELDWRARRFGWIAWYEPTAVATHERGGAGVRRTPTVEALNWSNRLLAVATCDDPRGLLRALSLVATTSMLKTIELAITVPQALPAALSRLRLVPRALARRRQLDLRAPRTAADVERDWFVAFRWRSWVRTWWDRVRGRPLGTRP
jgi:GT2 family glycosyltransferase